MLFRTLISVLLWVGCAAAVHADDALAIIPAGSFQMRGDDENAARTIDVKSFALAKRLVTRAEFASFIDETQYDAGKGWRKPLFTQADNHPVVNVSWHDALAYIDWLNKKTGAHYRLPTEAEWEYAARAGTTTPYYWGDDIDKARANCNDCGSEWDGDSTAPVGSFAPNPWGLFDMGGNAAQWVQDCFVENDKKTASDRNPGQTGACKYRVIRGGGWNDSPKAVRVDAREGNLPDFRYLNVGFRLAKDL